MTDKVLVLTTAGTQAEAQTIAKQLVESRLAACINLIPRIQSVYRWKGKLESTEEYLLIIKTSKTRATSVEAAIKEIHSYDLPECIVVPLENGSEEYLKWIEESVT